MNLSGSSVSGLWFYPKSVMTYKVIDCFVWSFLLLANHISQDDRWNSQDVNVSIKMCITQQTATGSNLTPRVHLDLLPQRGRALNKLSWLPFCLSSISVPLGCENSLFFVKESFRKCSTPKNNEAKISSCLDKTVVGRNRSAGAAIEWSRISVGYKAVGYTVHIRDRITVTPVGAKPDLRAPGRDARLLSWNSILLVFLS